MGFIYKELEIINNDGVYNNGMESVRIQGQWVLPNPVIVGMWDVLLVPTHGPVEQTVVFQTR